MNISVAGIGKTALIDDVAANVVNVTVTRGVYLSVSHRGLFSYININKIYFFFWFLLFFFSIYKMFLFTGSLKSTVLWHCAGISKLVATAGVEWTGCLGCVRVFSLIIFVWFFYNQQSIANTRLALKVRSLFDILFFFWKEKTFTDIFLKNYYFFSRTT